MGYVVRVLRHQTFLASEEVTEAQERPRSLRVAVGLTIIGLVTIRVAGELVAQGATGIIAA
jgi:hypothetical protein